MRFREFHIREFLDIVEAARVRVRERLHSGDFRWAGGAWDSLLECRLVVFALTGTLFRRGVRLERFGVKRGGWKRSKRTELQKRMRKRPSEAARLR